MAVTVTLSIPPCIAQEPTVEMDVHHLYETGEMAVTPLRTHPRRARLSPRRQCRLSPVRRYRRRSPGLAGVDIEV